MTPDPFAETQKQAVEDPFAETQLQQPEKADPFADTQADSGKDVSYTKDIATAVADGVRDGIKSTIDLVKSGTDWVGENVTGDIVVGPNVPGFIEYRSPSELRQRPSGDVYVPDIKEGAMDTMPGDMVHGVTQFLTGYVTGGRALQGVQAVSKGAKVAKIMAQGAIADFTAFNEHEQRLSNLIQSYPALANPITAALAAEEDDGILLGRFKNVIEGGILGLGAEGAAKAAKHFFGYIKAFREAKKMSPDDAAKHMDDAASKLADDMEADGTHVADDIVDRVPPEIDDAATAKVSPQPEPPKTRSGLDPEIVPKGISKNSVTKKEVEDLVETLTTEKSMLETAGASDIKGGINPTKYENASNALMVMDALAAKIASRNAKQFSEVQTVEVMQKIAAQMATNPENAMQLLREAAGNTEDLAPKLLAADALLKAIGEKVVKTIGIHGDVWENLAPEVQKELTVLLQSSADIMLDRGMIQKNVARAQMSGRIVEKSAGDIGVNQVTSLVEAVTSGENINDVLKMINRQQHSPRRVVAAMHGSFTGKTMDVLNEYFKASVLSHAGTQIINVLSGALEMVALPLEEAMAFAIRGRGKAAAGNVAGAIMGFTDNVITSFAMLKEVVTLKGLSDEGLSEFARQSPMYHAVKAFLKEENILDPWHRQTDAPTHAIPGLAGKVVRMPLRTLAAADELMKQMAYRNYIYQTEVARGLDAGLNSKQIMDRVKLRLKKSLQQTDLKDNYGNIRIGKGEGIDADALDYARRVTMTQDVKHGFGQWLKQGTQKMPFLQQVIPFINVPTNIVRHIWQRIPIIGMFQRDMKRAMLGNNPQAAARAWTKQIVGSTVALTAYTMALNGKITGYGPTDPNERRQWLDEGHQPYAIIHDDGSVTQYNRMDPRFALLGLAADLVEAQGRIPPDDHAAVAAAMATSVARNLTSKAYLTGITEVLDALSSKDPETGKRLINKHLSAYVPNGFKMFSDNVELTQPHNLIDYIYKQIPGLMERVDRKRNFLGEPMEKPKGIAFETLSPIYRSQLSDSKLDKILTDTQHPFQLPPYQVPGTNVDMREYRGENGRSAWDRKLELRGTIELGGMTLRQRLESLVPVIEKLPNVAGPEYDYMASERVSFINRIVRQYDKVADVQLMQEFPQLQADAMESELKAKIVPKAGPQALQRLLNH